MGEQITCINVAIFPNALTYGKSYGVLKKDLEKSQVKIKGDNDRVRWYPLYCFTTEAARVIKVKSIHIDDEITSKYSDAIEVTITIMQGTVEAQRWCYFLTPAYVYRMFGDSEAIPFTMGQHGIFLPTLTENNIQDAIAYLEKHNLLEISTLPLNTD